MKPIDFKNLDFTCSREADHVPTPSAKAQKLFETARQLHRNATATDTTDAVLIREAIKTYELAAREGHWKAVRNLANIYTFGVDSGGIGAEPAIKPNASKAIDYAQQLIKMNVATGFSLMAVFAVQGWGVKQDEKASLIYFRRAADLGSPEAQGRLGNKFTLEFNHLPSDQRAQMKAIGIKMLACAVRQGNSEAALQLASEYKVVEENFSYALFYYQQGGKMGDATCLYVLSEWFANGEHDYAIDKLRAEQYNQYSERADHREGPFPELDKALPLPPPPKGGRYPDPELGWPNAWTTRD